MWPMSIEAVGENRSKVLREPSGPQITSLKWPKEAWLAGFSG